jgi:hypothetical protein
VEDVDAVVKVGEVADETFIEPSRAEESGVDEIWS